MLHQNLSEKHWFEFSLAQQLANVGAEIGRSINWRSKNNLDYSRQAFWRGLELLDLTIKDSQNKHGLKELCRLREMLIDYFYFDNEYKSSDEAWNKYFYPFNFLARKN